MLVMFATARVDRTWRTGRRRRVGRGKVEVGQDSKRTDSASPHLPKFDTTTEGRTGSGAARDCTCHRENEREG